MQAPEQCAACAKQGKPKRTVEGRPFCSAECIGNFLPSIVTARTQTSLTLDWGKVVAGQRFKRFILLCNGKAEYTGEATTGNLIGLQPGTEFTLCVRGVGVTTTQVPITRQDPVYGPGRKILRHNTVTTGHNSVETELPPEDLVVLKVKTLPVRRVTPLDFSPLAIEKLRQEIINFVPSGAEELYLEEVNILLIGSPGNGKSAFYQSLSTALSGKMNFNAKILSGQPHVTQEYSCYSFRKWNLPGKVQIRDTYGWDLENFRHDEPQLMLDGKLPFGWSRLEPAVALDPRMMTAPFCDGIHVVAVIISAGSCYSGRDLSTKKIKEHFNRFRTVLDAASVRDIGVVIIVTKVDEIDEEIQADATLIVSSEAVYKRQAISEVTNYPMTGILVIKNYVDEESPDPSVDLHALRILQTLLQTADGYYLRTINAVRPRLRLPSGKTIDPFRKSMDIMRKSEGKADSTTTSSPTPSLNSTAEGEKEASSPGGGCLSEALTRLKHMDSITSELRKKMLCKLDDAVILRCHVRSGTDKTLFKELLEMSLE